MQKLISIILSALLLLSSSGLAYAKHYCGNLEIVSKVTLGEEHLSCDGVMTNTACGDELSEEGHFCCTNKYLKVSTDDQYAKGAFHFDFITQGHVFPESLFLLTDKDPLSLEYYYPWYYNPPPLEFDFQLLYETFLI